MGGSTATFRVSLSEGGGGRGVFGGGGGGGLQTYICYHVAALMISFNLISL